MLSKSNSKRFLSFLIVSNINFGKKISFNSLSSWLSNIAIFYYGFLTSQEIENENRSLECKQYIKKLLKNKNIYRKRFYTNDSSNNDLGSEF